MSTTDPTLPTPRHPDLTLPDLTESLLWPRLFEAGRLALAPHRLLIALATAVAVGILGSASLLWKEGPSFGASLGDLIRFAAAAIGSWFDGLSLARPWDLDFPRLAAAAGDIAYAARALFDAFPVSTFLLGLPMLVVLLLGWAAVARSAAWDFGVGKPEEPPALLAVAIRRLPTLLLAALGPPIFLALVVLAMAVFGWLLLELRVVDVAGAVLWGGVLLVALVLTPLAAAWVIGSPLLAPAVVCEGPDAFEAAQRAMAYVFGRPLRYLIYLATLIALGAILVAILALILGGANALATAATTALGGGEEVLSAPRAELEGTRAAAARVIDFWRALLALLLTAVILSYAASASAVLYLLLRKLNDGQDPADLAAEIAPA